jgi:hypothetical protein
VTSNAHAPSEPSSLLRELLCRFNRHEWVRFLDTESGEQYLQCAACGKDRSCAAVTRFL